MKEAASDPLPRFNGNKDGTPCVSRYTAMMIRALLFLLVSASLSLRASEPINVKYFGASEKVKQPHVIAELIPETAGAVPGKPFEVILHLHSDPGWHTYWINPGDAGLATKITWTLPEGFTAEPIQWPTPEKHKMGPLVTYGYEGDVYLITTITPPPAFEGEEFRPLEIKARASWLVCQEECIPGKGDFSVKVTYWNGTGPLSNSMVLEKNTALFDAARLRLPVPNTFWNVTSAYGPMSGVEDKNQQALWIQFSEKTAAGNSIVLDDKIYFFPEQGNVLNPQLETGDFGTLHEKVGAFWWICGLQQNGEKPSKISGVLVSSASSLHGKVRAVYIPSFQTDDTTVLKSHGENYESKKTVVAAPGVSVPSGGSASPSGGPGYLLPGSPQTTGGSQPASDTTTAPPLGTAAATSENQPFLLAVLGAAFIGGLILNLMPCVLPVLSLKVFSLMKHAEGDPRGAWKQGATFTAGVVISFWILAGLLLTLRAAGNHLGWGFQMQSPGFVLVLIFIFFLLALNLFGVFELGTSLVGLDAKVTGKSHGLTSSFLNGALATLAATPCTAPFMGSSLGFAAQQPAYIALLIFTFLALGMAAPYLLLTIFPGALKFVPKPGAWMEAFKQFMGFLLIATVIWLLYVFGALVTDQSVYSILLYLLLASILAWKYGRDQRAGMSIAGGIVWGLFLAGILLIFIAVASSPHSDGPAKKDNASSEIKHGWDLWSTVAVQEALADGHPVFVDFTAAWCLSCKVNERVALDTDAVRKAFADKDVMLFKADWTHSDPEISKALQQYNRDGVPLYLLYSPKDPTKPQVLPEVLTPGIVLDALNKL